MALNGNTQLVYSAQRGGRALLRFSGSSANVLLVANSSANADISTANSTIDPIVGASVSGVWWSLSGNSATVTRVVNSTVNAIIGTISGTGDWNRNDGWMGGWDFQSSNVVVTFNTSATGTVYVEFVKQYSGGDSLIEHQ